MERDQLRLELVRLCYKGHEPMSETIAKARELEAFVAESQAPAPSAEPAPAAKDPKQSKKKGDNSIFT